jgi:hypothetical protein
MGANGISKLATKQLRQEAKLALAAEKNELSFNLDYLPSKYVDNVSTPNELPDGLLQGRPWVERMEAAYPDLVPLTTGFGNDFVFTVETTGSDENFTIVCRNVGTFDATIDWGDGSTSDITSFDDAGLTHVYVDAGTHTIRVSGSFPTLYNNGTADDRGKYREILQFGDVGWLDLNSAFQGCSGLVSVQSGMTCEVGNVTRFDEMFEGCNSLTTINLSTFQPNSTNVVMVEMFRDTANAGMAEIDFSGFAGVAPIQMQGIFRNAGPGAPGLDVIGLEEMDYSAVQNGRFNDFARFSTLSVETYDAFLIRLADQNVIDTQTVDFGNSRYTNGSASDTARTSLINDDGWTIQDAGSI